MPPPPHLLPKEAFRSKGAWWNAEQNKNTNSNSYIAEGQRKSPKMNQSNWKGALQKPLWEEQPYKMLKRTTKPLRRRVFIEEGTAESSKKQHSENTDKWHLCHVKQVVFRTVNHRGPLPLRELHSTGETIVWRDPGGSWACLPPVYKCNHPATVCDTCGIHPKQHTKKRRALGNTKKTKITSRTAGTWVEEVYEKDLKGSIVNERRPLLNGAKPLSTNNSCRGWRRPKTKS